MNGASGDGDGDRKPNGDRKPAVSISVSKKAAKPPMSASPRPPAGPVNAKDTPAEKFESSDDYRGSGGVTFDSSLPAHIQVKRMLRKGTPLPVSLEEQSKEHRHQLEIWGEAPPPPEVDKADLVTDSVIHQ
eukprot:CAMPEP_0185833340 /NCGR_PEP_ID=MMETSP1353-20130828/2615_1 /TAXON_ID=1077150 /ORGANISM="Erythrolobus australicus, Strain CCMP3124" /LENGTH=130 /DNA_ID=CAMNT_0028531609 /DNA_START=921 /DNA_END=1313 /DNA_ORIENTATION=-